MQDPHRKPTVCERGGVRLQAYQAYVAVECHQLEGDGMIFASCVQCGYAMDISQEPSELFEAPLSCPRCGGLDLKLQMADDLDSEAA
jgi:DNA replicative helicase MCM subunit Mcm2 (Cdc46/Mcm family)